MASRAAGLVALFKQGQLCRLNLQQSSAWLAAKGFAADVNTNAPAGESRQGDYNTQAEALKEDFIATPMPEVPADVRANPKHAFPHQTDEERKADLDVPDEGEGITKVPEYTSHNDPSAAADPDPTKRAYHTASGSPLFRGVFRAGGVRFAGARALHASAARRMDDSKHPDQQRAEDLTNEKTDDDPTAGTLGGDKAYLMPGVEDEAARDPGRLFDKDTLQEKRRAKDPEYFDRVHPGNPGQKAEQQADEGEKNAHAQKREAHDATFNSDAESNRVSGA